jgi:hypothetical protein
MDHFVARAAVFQRIEPSAAAAITERLPWVDYRPGQLIFAEGARGDRSADRSQPRDGQQDAGRFCPSRLDRPQGKDLLILDTERLTHRARPSR